MIFQLGQTLMHYVISSSHVAGERSDKYEETFVKLLHFSPF